MKRKEDEEDDDGEQEQEDGEDEGMDTEYAPAQRRRAGGNPDSALRSSGRERKSVSAFDPSLPVQTTELKKGVKAKKSEPTVAPYTPSEKETFGKFIVQVDNDWRSVKGFRVFEYKGDPKELASGMSAFTKIREWYCAKQLEPVGGFLPGHQGFMPSLPSFSTLRLPSVSYVEWASHAHQWGEVAKPLSLLAELTVMLMTLAVHAFQVDVVHMIKDWGTFSRKFIEVVGEQERVAEAYEKLPPDLKSTNHDKDSDDEDDEPDDDGDDGGPRPAKRRKKATKARASDAGGDEAAAGPESGEGLGPAGGIKAGKEGKGAPSGFMIFVNERRKDMQREEPDIRMPEVAKRCGELWRSMTPEEKEPYQKQSAELRSQVKRDKKSREKKMGSSKRKKSRGGDGEGDEAGEAGEAPADGARAKSRRARRATKEGEDGVPAAGSADGVGAVGESGNKALGGPDAETPPIDPAESVEAEAPAAAGELPVEAQVEGGGVAVGAEAAAAEVGLGEVGGEAAAAEETAEVAAAAEGGEEAAPAVGEEEGAAAGSVEAAGGDSAAGGGGAAAVESLGDPAAAGLVEGEDAAAAAGMEDDGLGGL